MNDAFTHLSDYVVQEHLGDAVRTLATQTPNDVALLLDESTPAAAARLVTALPPAFAERCLALMNLEKAAATLESVPVDAAARLLSPSDAETRAKLLDKVEPSRARAILEKLRFEKDTAGAMADTSVRAYDSNITIGEVRNDLGGTVPPYIYVVDPAKRLIGVVHSASLQADPATPLRDLMEPDVVQLNHHLPVSIVRKHPAWSLYECLPVVDAQDVFVGVVRHKTIRKISASQPEKYAGEVAMETLLSLGELYWRMGSKLMFGGVLQARGHEPKKEVDHVE